MTFIVAIDKCVELQ